MDNLHDLKTKVSRNIGAVGYATTDDFKRHCGLTQNDITKLINAGHVQRIRVGSYQYNMTTAIFPVKQEKVAKTLAPTATPEELAAAKKGAQDTIGYIQENLTFAELDYLEKHLPTVYLNSLHRMKEIDMRTYEMLLEIGFNYIPAGQKILATGVRKYIKKALEL